VKVRGLDFNIRDSGDLVKAKQVNRELSA